MGNYTPVTAAENAVKSARLLVQTHRDDIDRSQKREEEALRDLANAEKALAILSAHWDEAPKDLKEDAEVAKKIQNPPLVSQQDKNV